MWGLAQLGERPDRIGKVVELMEEAYTLYVLQSEKDGGFYVGQTVNLGNRIFGTTKA